MNITQVDDAHNIYVVMLLYNLIKDKTRKQTAMA